MSLFAPQPASIARAARFKERQRAWQSMDRKFYPLHASLEPYAPAILAACFDGAAQVVGRPAYYYRSEDLGQTIAVHVENWRWHALDGTTDGRGLYEIWAWRWDLEIPRAATELWCILNEAQDQADATPKRRRRAA
jgi:hypothetical protein